MPKPWHRSTFYTESCKRRADERTRTAFLLITSDPSGVAGDYNSRIDKLVSLLRLALGCIVLRSRWCQEYVNIGVNCSFHRYAQGGIRVSLTQHCLVASIVHDQLVAGH